jgi:hypothetical protein
MNESNKTQRPKFCVTNIQTQNLRYVFLSPNILTTWFSEKVKGKIKEIPLEAWTEPEAPRFQDNRHMKVVRLLALCTGRLYHEEIFLVLISVNV